MTEQHIAQLFSLLQDLTASHHAFQLDVIEQFRRLEMQLIQVRLELSQIRTQFDQEVSANKNPQL